MSDDHKNEHLPAVIEPQELVNAEAMHPLVQVAVASGQVDPATMRELLAVQRDWESGEARKAYVRDMALVKADLPPVLARDATGHTNNYTSLAHLTSVVTEPLAGHGFTVGYETAQENAIAVTCRITHHQGHSETVTLAAPADKGPGRSEVQAIGSTITYLRRYTLAAALGLATADMADADGHPDDEINPTLNARAASRLKSDYKVDREQAEEYLGRGVSAWTRGDLARLRTWVKGDDNA